MTLQQRGLRLLDALGRTGVAGLLLLVAALGWQLLVNGPLQARGWVAQADLQAESLPGQQTGQWTTQQTTQQTGQPAGLQPGAQTPAAAARPPGAGGTPRPGPQPPATPPDGAAALAAFEASLPRLQELPQLLARIDQGAAAQHVELRAGEYRLDRQSGERWLSYRITLPVRARYAQVRGLVDHVLVQLPTAALDDIELQRDGSGAQAPLQARLRFTLYLRP